MQLNFDVNIAQKLCTSRIANMDNIRYNCSMNMTDPGKIICSQNLYYFASKIFKKLYISLEIV